jgi:hypothetical protein
MKLLFISLVFCFSFLLFNSCHERGPLFPPPALGLGLRDFSCTEAWIEVQVGNNDKTANIYIKKDDEIIKTITLGQSDSIFYFDNLLPNASYKFDAVTYDDGKEIKSNPVTFTTLDTTSHNFTWQTFEFGQHSSSTFYDVSIIDENNIWAVGEIYMNDSLGNPDPKRYNAAIWNGTGWEIIRVPYVYQGQPFYNPIQSVCAFSDNDIWFCGNGVIHWDGNTFIPMPIPINVWGPYQMNKIWGSCSNDLYAVGNNGNIAHYNGSSWTKIASGTSLPFQDIWGVTSNSEETQILAIASNKFSTGGKYLVKINGNIATHLNDLISTAVSLSGTWFTLNKKYYLVGDGIYSKHSLSDNKWQIDQIIYQIQYYPYSIRGNNINDIIVSGEAGTISHFNGISWKIFNGISIYDRLLSVSVRNNIVIAVGTRYNNGINNQGIIYVGIR